MAESTSPRNRRTFWEVCGKVVSAFGAVTIVLGISEVPEWIERWQRGFSWIGGHMTADAIRWALVVVGLVVAAAGLAIGIRRPRPERSLRRTRRPRVAPPEAEPPSPASVRTPAVPTLLPAEPTAVSPARPARRRPSLEVFPADELVFENGPVVGQVTVKNITDRRLENLQAKVHAIRALDERFADGEVKAQHAIGLLLTSVPQTDFGRFETPPAAFSLNPGEEHRIGVIQFRGPAGRLGFCVQTAEIRRTRSGWTFPRRAKFPAGRYHVTIAVFNDSGVYTEFTVYCLTADDGETSFRLHRD